MADLLRKSLGTLGMVPDILPASAGWRYVGFEPYRLKAGNSANGASAERGVIYVVVEAKARINAADRDWVVVGKRMDVFDQCAPHCQYLPNGRDWQATGLPFPAIAMTKATLPDRCANDDVVPTPEIGWIMKRDR